MSNKGFDKFINKELKGAKKKEALKQEKRKYKAERREQAKQLREQLYLKATNQLPSNAPLKFAKKEAANNEPMALNKYVAHCGVCGRREAVELIKKGEISINNKVETNPAYKVQTTDTVKYKGKTLFTQTNLVYILLNKPKDYITSLNDDKGRKTVIELVKHATHERIFPVGRLDRNTTGVLLLTNDGELAQKLTHPSFQIKKIYEVGLDKQMSKKDLELLAKGVTLEDGFIKPDAIGFSEDKQAIGVEIHSGKNRIVRRMFEHLGYKVIKLDRVLFANLTKKNVNRGKWRMLTDKEVRLLKYMNSSFIKKAKEEIVVEEKSFKREPKERKPFVPKKEGFKKFDGEKPARKSYSPKLETSKQFDSEAAPKKAFSKKDFGDKTIKPRRNFNK